MMRAKISTNKGIVEEAFAPFHVNIFATELSDLSEKIIMDKVCNMLCICHHLSVGTGLKQSSINDVLGYNHLKSNESLFYHNCYTCTYIQFLDIPVRGIHNLLQVYQASITYFKFMNQLQCYCFLQWINSSCVSRILSQFFSLLFRLQLRRELCHMSSEKSNSADSYTIHVYLI